jgi:hypothetical protein
MAETKIAKGKLKIDTCKGAVVGSECLLLEKWQVQVAPE